MNRPAILGLILGSAIGGIYIALQRAELQRKNGALQSKGVRVLIPGAVGRLLFLAVSWWMAYQFTSSDRYWLTGSLAVAYSLPLFWQLKQMIFPKG